MNCLRIAYQCKQTDLQASHQKHVGKDKISEVEELAFDKSNLNSEIELIHSYFKDDESFKFVMTKPYLELDFAGYSAELVRMTHKKYKPSADKFYRQPNKSYSWTWRWKKITIEQKKKDLVNIINRYISQTDKSKALEDLEKWQTYFQTYAVFRGMRQQVGRLYTLGKLFFYSRSKRSWDEENLPYMTLYFISRYKLYAGCYEEYELRRAIFINFGKELPRYLAKQANWDEIEGYLNSLAQ
ncbi:MULTISPECIES: hypothetical protein [unclassified Acinetobacter]|uniref:hypothetical protein n=1 Tax=unclassified Acinetobacter TaxID=196816 RepID=UPI001BC873F5|nr:MULTISPECIES: hypothetical protein [unclassified Acinetobacter]